jgi:hypothetical protein
MCLAQDNDVLYTFTRIDPISRSTKLFCQGEAGPMRAGPCRSAVALPVGATSNASSRESRLCANARASRAG